jgi:hypothetical protein
MILVLSVVAGMGALVAASFQDIKRYMTIRRM